jgi:chromosome segregation ATPase
MKFQKQHDPSPEKTNNVNVNGSDQTQSKVIRIESSSADAAVIIMSENIIKLLVDAGMNDSQVESVLDNVVKYLCKSSHATVERLCQYRGIVQKLVMKASEQIQSLQDEAKQIHRQIDTRRLVMKEIQATNDGLSESVRIAELENSETMKRLEDARCLKRNTAESLKTQKEAYERVKKTHADYVRKNATLLEAVNLEEARAKMFSQKKVSLTNDIERAETSVSELVNRLRDIQHQATTNNEQLEEAIKTKQIQQPAALSDLRRLEETEEWIKTRFDNAKRRVEFLQYQLNTANNDAYDTLRHLTAMNDFTLYANSLVISTAIKN